jgi:hypothetical protein
MSEIKRNKQKKGRGQKRRALNQLVWQLQKLDGYCRQICQKKHPKTAD